MSQSRARAWALFGAVVLVSACGGGGGDGGTSNPPSVSPPPAQEEFLTAGFGQTGQAQTLVVIDPAQPSRVRLSALVDQHLEVSHLTFDTAGRRVTLGHETMVFYVRGGILFQVSLRKNQSQVQRRISSLTTACSVKDWHPFSYNTGDDGWAEVTEAGPDGSCLSEFDNRTVFVRHNTPSTDAPTMLPDGMQVMSPLPDLASHSLLGFIAVDRRATSSKLVLYSPTFVYVGDVVGGAGRSSLEFLAFRPGGPLTTSAYVKVDSTLMRLDWSSTSATLTSQRHVFSSIVNSDRPVALGDSNAMYFLDGLVLRRIDGAGTVSVLATLDAADGSDVSLMGLTSGHVVIQQSPTNSGAQVFTVPKLGGTPLRLAPTVGTKYVVGIHGEEVIYSTYGRSQALRRIRADGSNDRQITLLNSGFPMPVVSPTIPHLSMGNLDAVMWCDIPASGHCTNGTIRAYDLQSDTITTLGTLSHNSNDIFSLYVNGSGFSGRPILLSATASLFSTPGFVTDFYMVSPGTANSMVRITTNIP